ncbi:MAG: metallophosphoesterase family protein [Acidobacteriota bacterium]
MKLRLCAAVGFCLLGTVAWLRTAGAAKDLKIPLKVLHAPTAQPDRVILTWAGDPKSTQAVTWRTDLSVEKAAAEIAVAEDGPLFRKKSHQVPARTEHFTSELGEALYHSVQFEGLQPATKYVYRVGDGFNWSEWAHFTTASDKPEPFAFAYVGDAQNDIFEMWSRVIRSAYSDAPKLKFLIHAGDLINTPDRDDQWGEWHRAAGWINMSVPSVPVPGNHEYGKQSNGERALNRNWKPQFTLPGNGLPGLEETNYYLDIQGVRIIAINSNERQKEQAAWLDKVLANNPNKWTVVTHHHPIFSTAKGRDNPELRALLKPVYDKYRVDLVLTGHDHSYGRSNVVSGENRHEGGTVYVVSVSGPKMYEVTPAGWMQRKAEDTQLYQIIRVDGDRLLYGSRTARGVLYDSFELRKRRKAANAMVNRIPRTPENKRVFAEPSGAQ